VIELVLERVGLVGTGTFERSLSSLQRVILVGASSLPSNCVFEMRVVGLAELDSLIQLADRPGRHIEALTSPAKQLKVAIMQQTRVDDQTGVQSRHVLRVRTQRTSLVLEDVGVGDKATDRRDWIVDRRDDHIGRRKRGRRPCTEHADLTASLSEVAGVGLHHGRAVRRVMPGARRHAGERREREKEA
jgi:hypothetical protein